MARRYSMEEGVGVAKAAARDIEEWLARSPVTRSVRNVEDVDQFRLIDVDLVWETEKRVYRIEIKGDRWHGSGNFFFETESNREKGTPGCFLYTKADYVFYYFVVPRILYILPMPATRAWFLENMHRFRERSTTTPAGHGSYTTVGRLVPIETVVREVPGVKRANLRKTEHEKKTWS
jgi:hypothetical protein